MKIKKKYDHKQFEITDEKNKNQSGLKKKLKKCKNHFGLE